MSCCAVKLYLSTFFTGPVARFFGKKKIQSLLCLWVQQCIQYLKDPSVCQKFQNTLLRYNQNHDKFLNCCAKSNFFDLEHDALCFEKYNVGERRKIHHFRLLVKKARQAFRGTLKVAFLTYAPWSSWSQERRKV